MSFALLAPPSSATAEDPIPSADEAADNSRAEALEPDWMIWLEDVGFCPMMDCEPEPPGPPRVIQGRLAGVTVAGSLSTLMIRRYVRMQSNRYRSCYENGLRANPDLSGRVAVRFVFDHTGEVRTAQAVASTLGDSAVEECVVSAVRGIQFPATEQRGITVVTYPFLFRRSPGAGGSQEIGPQDLTDYDR